MANKISVVTSRPCLYEAQGHQLSPLIQPKGTPFIKASQIPLRRLLCRWMTLARERDVDSTSNSNVIAIPRLGSGSRRPPSIHADEFMARQREFQNSVAMTAADTASLGTSIAAENETDAEECNHSRKLKVDLDDDGQIGKTGKQLPGARLPVTVIESNRHAASGWRPLFEEPKDSFCGKIDVAEIFKNMQKLYAKYG
ncbi:hypothetical protein Ancab_015119 [Ancistrocladus abbreviatus]